MTLKVVGEFAPRWSVFWATTYTFGLGFLEEFLIRRLGNPPLNATVLTDFDHFAKAWDDLGDGDDVGLRRVNRDYLLRGVPWAAGAFHPKTYFLANRREGVLLVGSGNLRLEGMDQGNEVFCRFGSNDDEGLAAIRAWHDWMERVVVSLGDREVGYRWRDLQKQAAWLAGPRHPSPFVTNWDGSLLDHLAEMVVPPTDELHVLAPFFDPSAEALRRLIAATRPRRVSLYVPHGMSADGAKVREALTAGGVDFKILGYGQEGYVHAKLFGVTVGGRGWLLSGSTNASRVALLSTVGRGRAANVEAGVLVETDAEAVRDAFCPPGWSTQELSLKSLEALQLRHEPAASATFAIQLKSAATQSDGSLTIHYLPEWSSELFVTSGTETVRVTGDRTAGPLKLPDDGAVVWLVGADRARLSNKVPVDDLVRLKSWLQERAEPSERPRELSLQDLETPIGQILDRLNREFIFDVDDTKAGPGPGPQPGGEIDEGEYADIWERFAAEELRLEPRAARYERADLPDEQGFLLDTDDVSSLLRSMLDRVRGDVRGAVIAAAVGVGAPDSKGHAWTAERKFQVRLENVLRRWSRALADPRLSWLGPQAALQNYKALVTSLVAILGYWDRKYLREEQLVRVAFDLFSGFVVGERQPGYLLRLPENERISVLNNLDATPSIAAALAFLALHPTAAWKERVFAWQPFLRRALEWGVMKADDDTSKLVEIVNGSSVPAARIEATLRRAAAHTTDERLETRMEAELGLERIEISVDSVAHGDFPLKLEVWGVVDPLDDPALVSLVRRSFAYRGERGIMIFFPDHSRDDRMAFAREGAGYATIDDIEYECDECATEAIMEVLEEAHAGWNAFMSETVV